MIPGRAQPRRRRGRPAQVSSRPPSRGRPAGPVALAVLAVLLLLATPTAARADPAIRAGAPAVGAGAPAVGAPLPREFVGTLFFTVAVITPALITSTSGPQLTIRGTVRNVGTRPVAELQYVVQRGDRLAGPAAVSAELADPSQPQAVMTRPWTDLIAPPTPGADPVPASPGPATLAAGASAPLVVTVDISAPGPSSTSPSRGPTRSWST